MAAFRADGRMPVSQGQLARARAMFGAFRLDDAGTLATIRNMRAASGIMLDPHTAVAVAAADEIDATKRVVIATAHPAKFPDAVERATGERPALPARLADLFDRDERFVTLPAEVGAVEDHVRGRLAAVAAA